MKPQTVLIVGGTSDVSVAFAHIMARRGCRLILAGRDSEALDVIASDISIRFETDVEIVKFDALALNSTTQLVDALPELPDVVLSSLGYMPPQNSCQENEAVIADVVQTNFISPSLLFEELAARAVAEGRSICLAGISSIAGERGRAKNYWYGAAKAGFTAVLSGMRQRYRDSDVHVLTIKPGFLATRMTADMELPRILVFSAEAAARQIDDAIRRKKLVLYIGWIWFLVASVVRAVPETVFRRMKF